MNKEPKEEAYVLEKVEISDDEDDRFNYEEIKDSDDEKEIEALNEPEDDDSEDDLGNIEKLRAKVQTKQTMGIS